MVHQLLKIATLFRVTSAQLRRLARRPIRTERDTIVAIEAYLHRNQVRTALGRWRVYRSSTWAACSRGARRAAAS